MEHTKRSPNCFFCLHMRFLNVDPLQTIRKLLIPAPRISRRRIPQLCQCDPADDATNQKIQSMQQNANAVSHDLDTQFS